MAELNTAEELDDINELEYGTVHLLEARIRGCICIISC